MLRHVSLTVTCHVRFDDSYETVVSTYYRCILRELLRPPMAWSASLQTKLFRHTGIVFLGPIFDDTLSMFNTSMEADFLSNPSEIAAPKLMKKMADIYFTRVTKNAEPTFSLSPRQMALWTSQREDHTSDWLRTVPISGLGQTMNGRTVIDAAQRKRDKYMAKCAAIGYGFLPLLWGN
ncbi:hypothetical protein Tco_0682556 [Tanacetum coccineum]|uniref:Uncharacterized protein n=1 Tax=Tanacetum coccineum TaxID=301880 RepID=A0ABQ4XS38_9ASTR